MPTERFYRLPEGKKKTIREAAFYEFARVPFDKASINQIIKAAEISRGSFYTYFEDKWDVLTYIFEESQKETRDYLFHSMEQSGGDIWKAMESFMEKVIEICSGEEKKQFIKNVMNHSDVEEMFGSFKKHPGTDYDALGEVAARWLYSHYSREKMRELSYREFQAFFHLLIFSIAMELKGYFEGKTLDEVRESFRMKLRVLQQGVGLMPAAESA